MVEHEAAKVLEYSMDDQMLDYLVSETLDNMGLSHDQILWRRDMALALEFVMGLDLVMVNNIPLTCYVTGSSVEGLKLKELNSDVDVMHSYCKIHVIADIHDWSQIPGCLTVMLDTTNSHPGYVNLVLMSNASNTLMRPQDAFHLENILVLSSDGKLLLLNGFIKSKNHFTYSPAVTLKDEDMWNTDVDKVGCLHCDRWPQAAQEWITRHRASNCPSLEIVECLRKMGCLLVSTSHKTSLSPDVEWRFSFSLLERELVWCWPINQLKCYVLLKLMKDVINSGCMEKVCSYHMKTVMFWMTEENGHDWWESHSLMFCFLHALDRLLHCVESGTCPNYFIKDNNMFDTFTPRSRKQTARCIRDMIAKKHDCLLQSGVWQKFYRMTEAIILSTNETESVLCSTQMEYWRRVERCEVCLTLITLFGEYSYFMRLDSSLDCSASTVIERYLYDVSRLQKLYKSEHVHVRKSLLNIQIMLLQSHLASVLSSVIVHRPMSNISKHSIMRSVENMLMSSTSTDVTSGKLKLAVHFHRLGNIETARNILDNIVSHYRYFVSAAGPGYLRESSHQEIKTLSDFTVTSLTQDMKNCVALDSVFLLSEMVGVPSAMVYEIFKTIKNVKELANGFERYFPIFRPALVVDSIVLVYFLLFMCHHQLGNDTNRCVALDNLRWTTSNQADTYHKATALNLLGSCYMTMGDMRRATDCFVKSLKVRSAYTAASLHMLTVLRKCFASQPVTVDCTQL